MVPTVYTTTSSTHKDWLWPLSDPATVAVGVMVAIFLTYAVGYFNGYDSALAVLR